MDRPKRLTPEMAIDAATSLVADLVKAHLVEARDADQSITEIAECGRRHEDGYKLAKMLDDRYGWDCDFELAEALCGFVDYSEEQIKKAQKEWLALSGMTPLPVGTRIAAKWGRDPVTGIIEEISNYGIAQYVVKGDGDEQADGPTRRRMLIAWEDATPLEEVAS